MYERILVPVDGSPTSNLGLGEAIKLAKLAKLAGSRLKLIHVVDELSYVSGLDGYAGYSVDLFQMLREGGQKILDSAKARAQASGLDLEVVMFDNFAGRVSDLVVGEAVKWRADLIVLDTHGRRGVKRFVLGSDAEQIVRAASVPVFLVRGDESVASNPQGATTAAAPRETTVTVL